MKTVMIIFFILLVSACATTKQEKQNTVLPNKLIYDTKRDAGYVYGVAYSSLTVVSRILDYCENVGVDKTKEVKAGWESRNTINLRAANFMLSTVTQSSEEENIAKEIIEAEANPIIEEYLKNNLNADCVKQLDSIDIGSMDVARDKKVKNLIENYIKTNRNVFATISSKITDKKVHQALAATISIKKWLYSSLEYCTINYPEHSDTYEKFRSSWLSDSYAQLNAANLLISVTYLGYNQNGNPELAGSFINFIKEHSSKVSGQVVFSLSENKERCKTLFNDYKQSPSLKGIPGYEYEVLYISESYKTFLLNNKTIPDIIEL